MYPPELVAPMKTDLTMAGFEQLQTPEQVDKALSQPGTVLCVVNSVCGCAAGVQLEAGGAAAVGFLLGLLLPRRGARRRVRGGPAPG